MAFSGAAVSKVLVHMVPLYFALALGYCSVRWRKISLVQCEAFNQFVAYFAFPFFLFQFILKTDPYKWNYRAIVGGVIAKVILTGFLAAWAKYSKNGSYARFITSFSLATLTNALVIGVPLLNALYGNWAGDLVVQLAVLQSFTWLTVLLFLLEWRKALEERKMYRKANPQATRQELPKATNRDGQRCIDEYYKPIYAEVVKQKQEGPKARENQSTTPNQQAFTKTFDQRDHTSVKNLQNNNGTPTEEEQRWTVVKRKWRQTIPKPNRCMSLAEHKQRLMTEGRCFTCLSLEERNQETVVPEITLQVTNSCYENASEEEEARNETDDDVSSTTQVVATNDLESGNSTQAAVTRRLSVRSLVKVVWGKLAFVGSLMKVVVVKLALNPNSYASLIGITGTLVVSRYHLKLSGFMAGSVDIVAACVDEMAKAGRTMAMFSMGTFMAKQKKFIACGTKLTLLGMALRFLVGPVTMAIGCFATGLRGDVLRVAIIQAAVPQSITSFVYALEYKFDAGAPDSELESEA